MTDLKKILVYYLPIIMIATGVSFTLLFETWPMKITGAVLCVLGTAMLIAYYNTLLKRKGDEYEAKVNEIGNQPDERINELEEQLRGKDAEIKSLKNQSQTHIFRRFL